jgi:cytosine/uracil/thiamine/allantoin permease
MSASPVSTAAHVDRSSGEAPLTLTEPAPSGLGLRDTFGLWANLGISLLLPVAAAFVVLAGRPLGVTVLAIAVGSVIGAVLLGLTAAPAARERVPAMVMMRGLLGRRASYLPTALNVLQCVGWATFEIVVIAEAASRALDAPRWPFVLAAGTLATAMAMRPLGVVRLLARYAVWAALAAVAYLFVRVLREPLTPVTEGGAGSFWSAVDIVIALPVSWFPLAADYTRHARDPRTAFLGSAGGYGAANFVMFTLGVLALAAYGAVGLDVIDALLAVPFGLLAVLVLVTVEVDEASPTSTPRPCRRRTSSRASTAGSWRCWSGSPPPRWPSPWTSWRTSRSCSCSERCSCRSRGSSSSPTTCSPAAPGTSRTTPPPACRCCCRGPRASWPTS